MNFRAGHFLQKPRHAAMIGMHVRQISLCDVSDIEADALQIFFQRRQRAVRIQTSVEKREILILRQKISMDVPQTVRHARSYAIKIFSDFRNHVFLSVMTKVSHRVSSIFLKSGFRNSVVITIFVIPCKRSATLSLPRA